MVRLTFSMLKLSFVFFFFPCKRHSPFPNLVSKASKELQLKYNNIVMQSFLNCLRFGDGNELHSNR